MLHVVRLERLPDGIRFPVELAEKMSYSAERRQLQFEGFMSKTDFDKLVRLHNDLAYQRALEQLFQICTFSSQTPSPARRSTPAVLSALAGAGIAAVLVVSWIVWRSSSNSQAADKNVDQPSEVHAANIATTMSTPSTELDNSAAEKRFQFVSGPAGSDKVDKNQSVSH